MRILLEGIMTVVSVILVPTELVVATLKTQIRWRIVPPIIKSPETSAILWVSGNGVQRLTGSEVPLPTQ
jgi:hypothetical protein